MAWTDTLTDDTRRMMMRALDQRGAEYLDTAGGDRPYAAFLMATDTAAWRDCGVSIFDLPDYNWRATYDQGMSPTQALAAALDTVM
ncbi:MAG TPA: hypothetical protein VJT31_26265 [Rugosimonospora sp.]|nr:hypothetical protein [Rugosimonospora sp.]